MKLNKKFLASFTALTMAVAPVAAFADTGTNNASSIIGTGTVNTLETEIYNVVLPTSESVNFNVDPYGLLTVPENTSLKDVVSNAAGTVTSKATAVVNKSSVGIHVDVDVYLDADNASNSAVTLASTKEEAQKGQADLYLEVINLSGASLEKVVTGGAADLTDASVAVSSDAIDLSGKAFTLSSEALAVTGSSTSVSVAAITATGASTDVSNAAISFDLGDVADAYFVNVTKNATTGAIEKAEAVLSEGAVTYTPNNVYAFAITGYANPDAQVWSDIQKANGELQLTLKFTISKQAEEPEPEPETAYFISTDKNGSAYIGVESTGGVTSLDLLSDVKVNGVSTTTYSSVLNGCFLLVKGKWANGDVVTFTYDGVSYSVTL
jgi:uncharacterized protein YfcZ (UPF0381/DUF406 family)